jgi:hypothetical protein
VSRYQVYIGVDCVDSDVILVGAYKKLAYAYDMLLFLIAPFGTAMQELLKYFRRVYY